MDAIDRGLSFIVEYLMVPISILVLIAIFFFPFIWVVSPAERQAHIEFREREMQMEKSRVEGCLREAEDKSICKSDLVKLQKH